MKQVLVVTINIYQNVLSAFLKQLLGVRNFCRFDPTCSSYTKEAIVRFGPGKGVYLGLKRILSCNPFQG